ncbi:MAG: peptidase, partial [Ferruginibacter sp.]|nr:peptidase [Ferruginibacter sp.]
FVEKTNPRTIRAMINLEMLGRPEKENCFIVSFRNNAIRKMLNHSLDNYGDSAAKNFFINDPYPDEDLSRRSDHYPFAVKIKNAFTIMGSSPADIYYHSVNDEYQTIDFDFLLKSTRLIAVACEQFTK